MTCRQQQAGSFNVGGEETILVVVADMFTQRAARLLQGFRRFQAFAQIQPLTGGQPLDG
ncbi:hypothetical protein D3C87_2195930 [compost metagenome]